MDEERAERLARAELPYFPERPGGILYHKDKDKNRLTQLLQRPSGNQCLCLVFFFPKYIFFSSFGNIHKTIEMSLRISLVLVSGTGMTGIVNRQPGNEVDHHHELVNDDF